MSDNVLTNPGFEADWQEEKSHRVIMFNRATGEVLDVQVGNVFAPPGWVVGCRVGGEGDGEYNLIEARDAHAAVDPVRVHSGAKAFCMFKSDGLVDCFLMQRVKVGQGARVIGWAWGHCWSQMLRFKAGEHAACFADPHCSAGVGPGPVLLTADEAPTGDPWHDARVNEFMQVGIDPLGRLNPYEAGVVWGARAWSYNGHHRLPDAEAIAQADEVTLILRAKTRYRSRMCDAHFDDAELQVVEGPPEQPERGKPRVQYERTYLLLPPDADAAWALAAVKGSWEKKRYTVGSSADDACIGDLDVRRVIAVNAERWPTDLLAWRDQHYPGVEIKTLKADSPAQLERLLSLPDPGPAPLPVEPFLMIGLHDQAGGERMLSWGLPAGHGVCLVHDVVKTQAVELDYSRLQAGGLVVLCRLGWGYADGTGTMPGPDQLGDHVEALAETLRAARGVDYFQLWNEPNNASEWPGGPGGFPLMADYVAQAYNAVWRLTPAEVKIGPPALDPYYGPGSDNGAYLEELLDKIEGADVLFLHTGKTQTNDPAEIRSSAMFEHAPLTWQYLNARATETYSAIFRSWPQFARLPVFVAECNPQRRGDGSLGWDPGNSAWVHEMCSYLREQHVTGAVFYREELAGDQAGFGLSDKPAIIEAIRQEAS